LSDRRYPLNRPFIDSELILTELNNAVTTLVFLTIPPKSKTFPSEFGQIINGTSLSAWGELEKAFINTQMITQLTNMIMDKLLKPGNVLDISNRSLIFPIYPRNFRSRFC
jgi:hypothetical protein